MANKKINKHKTLIISIIIVGVILIGIIGLSIVNKKTKVMSLNETQVINKIEFSEFKVVSENDLYKITCEVKNTSSKSKQVDLVNLILYKDNVKIGEMDAIVGKKLKKNETTTVEAYIDKDIMDANKIKIVMK